MDDDEDTGLRTTLERLLAALLALGQEQPNTLLALTQPLLQDEYRVPLLTRMFAETPRFLEGVSPSALRASLDAPPNDAVPLRLLLELRQVQDLLRNLTYLTLAHLSKALQGHAPTQQLRLLEDLQSALQRWGLSALQQIHATMAQTPVHLERAALLQMEPTFSAALAPLTVQLLKMPYNELEAFKLWMEALAPSQLILLVNLLQMELSQLLDVRRRLIDPSASGKTQPTPKRAREEDVQTHFESLRLSGERESKMARFSDALWDDFDPFMSIPLENDLRLSGAFADAMDVALPSFDSLVESNSMIFAPTEPPQSSYSTSSSSSSTSFRAAPSLSSANSIVPPPPLSLPNVLPMAFIKQDPIDTPNWSLRIQKQPPAQTVYQRIVKPFPAVTLVGGSNQINAQYNLFVEATCVRADSERDIPMCLDGSRVIRIQTGALATFRKLKILATTAQQGCLFRVKFQLKRYEGTQFIVVPGAHVISNPIEVFSHTYYLTNRKKNAPPPPPSVTELLPPRGSVVGNTRCVILGANFIDTANLRVRFGDVEVKPTFHEAKTLICVAPPNGTGAAVVSVSNDGKDFCASDVTFYYE